MSSVFKNNEQMQDVKVILGLLAVMSVFAIFAHKGINSLFRGALNGIIAYMLLRVVLKSTGLYEYRILKVLSFTLACFLFIVEPFMFDNKLAKTEEDEFAVDGIMATGRSVIAYPVMVVGGIFILVTNI